MVKWGLLGRRRRCLSKISAAADDGSDCVVVVADLFSFLVSLSVDKNSRNRPLRNSVSEDNLVAHCQSASAPAGD